MIFSTHVMRRTTHEQRERMHASHTHGVDSVTEWLRRWTRNPLGSARRGANPLAVALSSCFFRRLHIADNATQHSAHRHAESSTARITTRKAMKLCTAQRARRNFFAQPDAVNGRSRDASERQWGCALPPFFCPCTFSSLVEREALKAILHGSTF